MRNRSLLRVSFFFERGSLGSRGSATDDSLWALLSIVQINRKILGEVYLALSGSAKLNCFISSCPRKDGTPGMIPPLTPRAFDRAFTSFLSCLSSWVFTPRSRAHSKALSTNHFLVFRFARVSPLMASPRYLGRVSCQGLRVSSSWSRSCAKHRIDFLPV